MLLENVCKKPEKEIGVCASAEIYIVTETSPAAAMSAKRRHPSAADRFYGMAPVRVRLTSLYILTECRCRPVWKPVEHESSVQSLTAFGEPTRCVRIN
ncbi:hypothetical protein AVEN_177004-1 [Araneus ventricosus]|uniref:Uncharacterized protein n=1 Tax=Araneus ventricosus TaxID=182803 RepID=A0A4Y2PSU1_ARAVE|nr:hypothetical protein AVEN_177004-1 [Araneus ventricosus]